MSASTSWLKELIVLNELMAFDDPWLPGDVVIFQSALGLRNHLQPWWITETAHFALSGIGDRVFLGVRGDKVIVERTEECSQGVEMLRAWLEPTAKRIHEMRADAYRKHKVATGSLLPDGEMPQSLEGLIAYIGFR